MINGKINGKKIAMMRKKRGLSQEQLAKKMSVSRASINNWENNKTEIERENLCELCNALNCVEKDLQDRVNLCNKNDYYDRFCSIETIDAVYAFVDSELEELDVDISHEVTTKYLLKKYCTFCLLVAVNDKKRFNDELTEKEKEGGVRWDIENYISELETWIEPTAMDVRPLREIVDRVMHCEEVTSIERAMFNIHLVDEYYEVIKRMNIADEMKIYIKLFIFNLRDKSYTNFGDYNKIMTDGI